MKIEKEQMKKLIILFLVLQPFLDVAAGLSNMFEVKNVLGISIRLLFYLFSSYYLLFKTKQKSKKIYVIITYLYLLMFSINTIINKDSSVIVYELQNTMNTFYFPMIFIFFLEIIKEYKITFNTKFIFNVFLIYIAFIFFPTILGINLGSYAISKTGSTGWFNSANSISSIISILLPIIFIHLKNNKVNILFIFITCLITLYCIATIGTKVPIISLGIILIFNLGYFIRYLYASKKIKWLLSSIFISVILFIIGILILPKTAFYKNIKIHMDFLEIDTPLEVVTDYKLLDHFVFSQRLTFLNNTHKNYLNEDGISKMIGIGYIEKYSTDEVSTKTIEIDYFDVFYRHGIIGFIIYFIPLIIFLRKKHKRIDNYYKRMNIKISLLLVFLLALFSGHIFIAPATSIIVALIFIIYHYDFFETKKEVTK